MDFFVFSLVYALPALALLQVVIDALSFELPKAVSKFAALSDRCLDAADCVVDSLISSSNPRDMLSILCEVHSLNSGIVLLFTLFMAMLALIQSLCESLLSQLMITKL
uniref:Aberrant root formation protein 4 n=1 Tax=Rhizophora mucronata TaxID=61149 RepID=A0A2P2LV66_RHIMU